MGEQKVHNNNVESTAVVANDQVQGSGTYIIDDYVCANGQYCLDNNDDVLQPRVVTGMGYDIKKCLAACDQLDGCVAVDIQSYTSDWDHSQDLCYLLRANTFSRVPNCHKQKQWMSCHWRYRNAKSDKPALAAPKQSEQKVHNNNVESTAVVANDQVQGSGTYIIDDYVCANGQYCLDNNDDVLQPRVVTGMGYDIKKCLAACDQL